MPGDLGQERPDPQRDAVSLLSNPATHGTDRVETVETHAARVFLAGERAYKLKKAVRYSYLDYSTPERRRSACEAELAVNRRFAPELYLGVAPITRDSDGRLRLDGPGEPVDWVVVMCRFATAGQFDRLADQGALTPALVGALADCIADAHAAAPLRPDAGGAVGLGRARGITVEHLRLAAGSALPAAAVEAWATGSGEALAAVTPLLERRRLDGRVRASSWPPGNPSWAPSPPGGRSLSWAGSRRR